MRQESQAMIMVRSDLCHRIDRIAGEISHMPAGRLCAMVDDIRHTAAEFEIRPVVAIARALERAIATDGRGAMVLAYLDAMREAAGCSAAGPDAGEAYLASIGVRMLG